MAKKKASSAPKKKAAKKRTAKKVVKNSLVANINRRKKAGKSRSKKDSTVSAESYEQMKQGWPHGKRKKKAARKRS